MGHIMFVFQFQGFLGCKIFDGAVRVNVHLYIFGQLATLERDERIEKAHEIAQCRFVTCAIKCASPLDVADSIGIGLS